MRYAICIGRGRASLFASACNESLLRATQSRRRSLVGINLSAVTKQCVSMIITRMMPATASNLTRVGAMRRISRCRVHASREIDRLDDSSNYSVAIPRRGYCAMGSTYTVNILTRERGAAGILFATCGGLIREFFHRSLV